MKSIFILFEGDDWKKHNPHKDPSMIFGYSMWGDICKKNNIRLLRGCREWFTNGKFVKYWEYKNGKDWKKVDKSIIPDIIYDKARNYIKTSMKLKLSMFKIKKNIEKYVKIVNSPDFSNLLSNKLHQSVIFSKYIPKSKLVLPGEVIKNDTGEVLVLKEFHGSGGHNVKFFKQKKIKVRNKLIMQKRIDALKDGKLKDIRIEFIGETPQHAFSRVAAKGKFHTNVSQGAYQEYLDLNNLSKLLKLSNQIIKPLKIFRKKIFSLEFLIESSSNKPFLMELNTMPGITGFEGSEKGKKILYNFLNNLTYYLFK